MSYLDKHLAKLNVTGESIADSVKNATANYINANFKDDPSFRSVVLDGVQKDARIEDMQVIVRSSNLQTIMTTNKFMILKPNDTANLGSIVEFDGYTFIVTDWNFDNPLFPKGKIEQCNNKITIVTSTTETQTGTDSMGRPIITKTPVTTDVPCLFGGNQSSASLNHEINQPNDRIKITVQYNNTTKLVKENDVYTFYDRTYKVKVIDFTNIYNGVGLLTIVADRDVV